LSPWPPAGRRGPVTLAYITLAYFSVRALERVYAYVSASRAHPPPRGPRRPHGPPPKKGLPPPCAEGARGPFHKDPFPPGSPPSAMIPAPHPCSKRPGGLRSGGGLGLPGILIEVPPPARWGPGAGLDPIPTQISPLSSAEIPIRDRPRREKRLNAPLGPAAVPPP